MEDFHELLYMDRQWDFSNWIGLEPSNQTGHVLSDSPCILLHNREALPASDQFRNYERQKTISENDFSVLIYFVPCYIFNRAAPPSSLPNIETWSHYNNEALSNIIQDFLFWPFYLPGREVHRPICKSGACQYEEWNRAGRLSTTPNLHFNWEVRTWYPNSENQ